MDEIQEPKNIEEKSKLQLEIEELKARLKEKENELNLLTKSQKDHSLSKEEVVRYSRQIILPQVGVKGTGSGDIVVLRQDGKTGTVEEIPLSEYSYTQWHPDATKRLIELYKSHHKSVGISIRNFKCLWELMTPVLNREFNLELNTSQVENRWRVLMRRYRGVVEAEERPGRAKKFFEFTKEMDELFGRKKSITVIQDPPPIQKKPELKRKKLTPLRIKRIQHFYRAQHFKIEREKLEIEKARLRERTRKNDLIDERNRIIEKLALNNMIRFKS